jgi:hypothetical protein
MDVRKVPATLLQIADTMSLTTLQEEYGSQDNRLLRHLRQNYFLGPPVGAGKDPTEWRYRL